MIFNTFQMIDWYCIQKDISMLEYDSTWYFKPHLPKIKCCIQNENKTSEITSKYCLRTLTRYPRINYMNQCITK